MRIVNKHHFRSYFPTASPPANFIQFTETDEKKPYAELWMGTHPSLPSYAIGIDKERVLLSELIKQNPQHYLGEKLVQEFKLEDALPFLFKVAIRH